MALFTDGNISSLEDLSAQDTSLADIAAVEGIDVSAKLALAQDEIGVELSSLLAERSRSVQDVRRVPAADLHHVVVSPPLKLWHTYRALELVYRDAYNNQLNDRYEGKRDSFKGLAKWAYEKLRQTGVGLAIDPVPKAAEPTLSSTTGVLTEATYYASVSWVNGRGEEGASAEPVALALSDATGLLITPQTMPSNAVGWNVFAGVSADSMVQQNLSPITESSWTQATLPSTLGRTAGRGQAPNRTMPLPRRQRRG